METKWIAVEVVCHQGILGVVFSDGCTETANYLYAWETARMVRWVNEQTHIPLESRLEAIVHLDQHAARYESQLNALQREDWDRDRWSSVAVTVAVVAVVALIVVAVF